MALFKRNQQQEPQQADYETLQYGRELSLDGARIAIEGYSDQQTNYGDIFASFEGIAENVDQSFAETKRIIASTTYTKQLAGIDMPDHITDYAHSQGLTKARRRMSEEDAAALKIAVISAHTRALFRTGTLAQDPAPQISWLAQSTPEDMPDKQHFMSMSQTVDTLEPYFYTAEMGTQKVIASLVKSLESDPAGIENFLTEVSELTFDYEKNAPLLRILARNVYDQGGNHELERAIETSLQQTNGAVVEKFIDYIEHDDNSLKELGATFEFARKTASLIVGRTVSLREVILASSVDEWPKLLREAYGSFKVTYSKEFTTALHDLLQQWEVKSTRTPSVKELRMLENRWIMDEDISPKEALRKRGKVAVADAYIETVQPQKEAIKKTKLVAAQPIIDARSRELSLTEIDNLTEVCTADFFTRNRCDKNQASIITKDISKILRAITNRPTGVRGTTSLEDIRPFKLQGTNNTLSIWRVNPAHYTGLSVSILGKDLRVMYCVRNGVVGVLGVYTHQEYDKVIEQLR